MSKLFATVVAVLALGGAVVAARAATRKPAPRSPAVGNSAPSNSATRNSATRNPAEESTSRVSSLTFPRRSSLELLMRSARI
ncbi:hypothetical protein Bcav_0149 [Beutenbergia cavernae DSM 12333]|uniref:Uncharacterized protein n=1 Tax=Beutenbergia cavernae (strain ATCC BAA-8 / DSM 12333 / CCUG 43141 / JCM 11478 / NBRC 16432 / NCIMB 13614 / HKI 0122) TaxID=471853 RepID=C5BVH4_BEUC1|nr:hypothetical protein Bcav_0149 [Beutenbergia cavernae DSM 12333]